MFLVTSEILKSLIQDSRADPGWCQIDICLTLARERPVSGCDSYGPVYPLCASHSLRLHVETSCRMC